MESGIEEYDSSDEPSSMKNATITLKRCTPEDVPHQIVITPRSQKLLIDNVEKKGNIVSAKLHCHHWVSHYVAHGVGHEVIHETGHTMSDGSRCRS